MLSINDTLKVYQQLLQETDIQKAYKEVLAFIRKVQVYIKNTYPEFEVSKNLYEGYLDLSFFTFTTKKLKSKDFKIVIVFLHKEMKFEGWLSAKTKSTIANYNEKFSQYDISKYSLSSSNKKSIAILETTLVQFPNFDNNEELLSQIETNIIRFISDVEYFLTENNII